MTSRNHGSESVGRGVRKKSRPSDPLSTVLSIVIPTKNRSEYLQRALLPISQLSGAVEVIVVDDGSTSEHSCRNELTCGRLRNIRYRRLHQSCGASAARNVGFRESTGDFIWFLDDDDYATPETVQDVLRALSHGPQDRILLMSRMIVQEGTPIRLDVPVDEADKYDRYRRSGVEVTTSCAIFPRDVVSRLRGWDETLPRCRTPTCFYEPPVLPGSPASMRNRCEWT